MAPQGLVREQYIPGTQLHVCVDWRGSQAFSFSKVKDWCILQNPIYDGIIVT